jgi:hypothetical protein
LHEAQNYVLSFLFASIDECFGVRTRKLLDAAVFLLEDRSYASLSISASTSIRCWDEPNKVDRSLELMSIMERTT